MIALTILVLLISYICYRMAFYNNKKYENPYEFPNDEGTLKHLNYMTSLIDELKVIPYKEVFITSFDRLKLHGKYYHKKDGAPIQIQMHGYHGNCFRDFSGGNKLAREAGFNTLIIDQRSHGKSEGKTISFGINESKDCISWINYLISEFGNDVEILLVGVSMGAASVLMSTKYELPCNVKAIIADCPYSSPKDILRKVIKEDMHLPANLVYPFIYLGALIYGRFKLTSNDPIKAMENCKIPVCLIHGEKDTFVPTYMSKKIYESCNSYKEILIVKDASHGMSYIEDTNLYTEFIIKFIENLNLKNI